MLCYVIASAQRPHQSLVALTTAYRCSNLIHCSCRCNPYFQLSLLQRTSSLQSRFGNIYYAWLLVGDDDSTTPINLNLKERVFQTVFPSTHYLTG